MAADGTWATLPCLIIVEILSYLSLTDRLSASTACKRWRSCLFQPSLWRSLSFKVRYGGRRRSKHLAGACGRFLREAVVEFDSQNISDVRECLRLLEIFADNSNLQKIVLRPTSCQVEWQGPYGGHGDGLLQRYISALGMVVTGARQLRHFSLGCIEELTDNAESFLCQLASHQSQSLQVLHISSVKENPFSYDVLRFPLEEHIRSFHHLHSLGIDYEHTNNDLLLALAAGSRSNLHKLTIHVHAFDTKQEKLRNLSWFRLSQAHASLEVTLNLIHSVEGCAHLLDILSPDMPLAHLRLLFCQDINLAAIGFISRQHSATLKGVHIIDGMEPHDLFHYSNGSDIEEDPFVMMAWRCKKLEHFTLIGWGIFDGDCVAIARLRGDTLKTFDVPHCCILTPSSSHSQSAYAGWTGDLFCRDVSRALGRTWKPVAYRDLHPAVYDEKADADTAYLHILLQDQA